MREPKAQAQPGATTALPGVERMGRLAPYTRSAEETVVALDVGSARVACALSEIQLGRPVVVAAETVPSYGIRGGEIVDLERASESIRIAVEAVGGRAEADVRSVVVGFSGDIRLQHSRGVLDLDREHRAVQAADVARLRRTLWPECGPGRKVVHRFDGPYAVGDLRGIERPVGLSGATLGMASSFLTAPVERVENLLRAVRLAGVEVENLALEPFASSLGVLTADERALGVAVLDFGAGGFRGALWEGGRLRQICALGQEHHTPPLGAIPASGGMEGIVLSLARRFRIAPATAGRLLQRPGQGASGNSPDAFLADLSQAALEVDAVDGLETSRIHPAEWAAALEALFCPVARGLRDGLSFFSPGHAGGVVLVGNGAQLPGLAHLVSRHFGGAPTRAGTPHWEVVRDAELPAELEGPGGGALCGLAVFGVEARARLRERRAGTWWGRMRRGYQRVIAAL